MKKDKTFKILELKSAIRLLVSGWTFKEGEIEEALDILEEVWNDYKDEIKKQGKEI